MLRNNLSLIAVLAAMLVDGQAVADTVEDRKAKMDAQIELLRKEADLQDALRRVAGSSAVGMPTVVSISLVGERGVTKLLLENGTTEYFHEGDMIRQGMMVSVITRKQVIVAITNGKKKRVAVPLSNVTVANPVATLQQPGQVPNVPPELLPPAPDVSVPSIVMPAKPPVVASPAAAQPVAVATPAPASPAAAVVAKGK